MRVGPMYNWRFIGRVPDRVRVAPPDLRIADPHVAQEIYSSRFPLAGHLVDTGGASPFQPELGQPGWRKALNSFRWLRHLSAAGTDLAAHNARALVADWINIAGKDISGSAWDPGTTAKRVVAWLQHSSLILGGAELPFYRAFLTSLATQIRYVRATAPEMDLGKDRLRARIALAFASLSLPTSAAAIRTAARNLDAELAAQILPDGGHVSRNPLTNLELLADLLPLRQTYVNQAEPPPAGLAPSIDRMMQALRFFRHADGSLARFNGMGMTIHERVNSILRHDDPSTSPLLHAPASGYDRLALGQTIVIVDTGVVPLVEASSSAHAGCLSFEMSSGRSCLIVNCGVDSYGPAEYRSLARATAAHSTATIQNTSQGRFDHPTRLHNIIGAPLLGGARHVTRRRFDGPYAQAISASHDAYAAKFGLTHERELRLGKNGSVLAGTDRFVTVPTARSAGVAVSVTIRFHLHPDVSVFRVGNSIGLAGRNDPGWLFECPGMQTEIEESIFFAGTSGPRGTKQLTIQLSDARDREIDWRLVRQNT